MKNYIKIRIAAHADKVIKKYGKENVLGVFLYGSQNYNLATKNSDVDTVAIIVPTFSDLCLRSPISKELNIDGEHCNVKDIREYMKMIRKQNINFTETLFTEYRWVNTNDFQGYFTRFCAGGVLVAVPVTILFMCLQKYYVEGVTGGAVKG